MATTYPLPTLAATLSDAGITIPTYADIYASLQASFQSIYGGDVYLEPDSQDGQLLALVALAIHDCNQSAVAIYQSFSPSAAVGSALSANVKINGIKRREATKGQVGLTLAGVVGTVIQAGSVADGNGVVWDLPDSVTIPLSGQVSVVATCRDLGSIVAEAGTVTNIRTPTLGWQSVTNPAAAIPGDPIEFDGELRQRQAISTALPSRSVLEGLGGAIASLPGVTHSRVYENDTGVVDANGLPPHSISVVTAGGDVAEVGEVIRAKKTPGAATYGTTSQLVAGADGLPTLVNFFLVTPVTVAVRVIITARAGYLSPTGVQIKEAVSKYINDLGIGRRVDRGRLFLPAQLYGAGAFSTFEVEAIQLAASPGIPGDNDLEIAFNQMAACSPGDVVVVVGT